MGDLRGSRIAVDPACAAVAASDFPQRERVMRLLARSGATTVLGAADPDAALELAAVARPALYVVGFAPPELMIAVLEEILAVVPRTKVVLLAAALEEAEFLDAVRAGAAGYVPAGGSDAALLRALADVAAGRPAVPRTLLPVLLAQLRG